MYTTLSKEYLKRGLFPYSSISHMQSQQIAMRNGGRGSYTHPPISIMCEKEVIGKVHTKINANEIPQYT